MGGLLVTAQHLFPRPQRAALRREKSRPARCSQSVCGAAGMGAWPVRNAQLGGCSASHDRLAHALGHRVQDGGQGFMCLRRFGDCPPRNPQIDLRLSIPTLAPVPTACASVMLTECRPDPSHLPPPAMIGDGAKHRPVYQIGQHSHPLFVRDKGVCPMTELRDNAVRIYDAFTHDHHDRRTLLKQMTALRGVGCGRRGIDHRDFGVARRGRDHASRRSAYRHAARAGTRFPAARC